MYSCIYISTCITKWVCSFLRLSAVGAEVRAKFIYFLIYSYSEPFFDGDSFSGK